MQVEGKFLMKFSMVMYPVEFPPNFQVLFTKSTWDELRDDIFNSFSL